MLLRRKFLLAFSLLSLPPLIVGVSAVYFIQSIRAPLEKDIPLKIEVLTKSYDLDTKALYIRYYDEVLTQSARNYAFTGNHLWKERYLQEVPKLDTVIKEALQLGDEEDKLMFSQIDQANLALVSMETEALDLVDAGQLIKAQSILDSPDYSRQKTVYQNGLIAYAKRRGQELDKAKTASADVLEQSALRAKNIAQQSITQILLVLVFSVFLSVSLALFLSRLIGKPLEDLKNSALEIAKGKFDQTLPEESNDELGQVARAFNTMVSELKSTKASIEDQVAQRTQQLEKLNKFMVNRELKMAELKEKLHER